MTFAICFTIRSGSTALTNDLAALGVCEPDEPFQCGWYDPATIGECLTARKPLGFKISYPQASALLRELTGREMDESGADLRPFFRRLRFFHLVRQDKVAQAVSIWRARRTGVWHGPSECPAYDFAEVHEALSMLLIDEWRWRQFFTRNRIAPVVIYTEDYERDRLRVLRKITKVSAGPLPPTVILRDGESLEIARRFHLDLMDARQLVL